MFQTSSTGSYPHIKSVSYTHLDVYKRQVLSFFFTITTGELYGQVAGSMIRCLSISSTCSRMVRFFSSEYRYIGSQNGWLPSFSRISCLAADVVRSVPRENRLQ